MKSYYSLLLSVPHSAPMHRARFGRHNKEPASRKERADSLFSKENKRTGLDESQPQQSLQGEQQEEINLHLPPSDYVEPCPGRT